MRSSSLAIVLLSLCGLFPRYRSSPDDSIGNSFYDRVEVENGHFLSIREEIELFERSGMCTSSNHSAFIKTCAEEDTSSVSSLRQLQETSCYCDYSCHAYHDCCINRVGKYDYGGKKMACRNVMSPTRSTVPLYVYQQCPNEWDNTFIRDMCEMEAFERQKLGLHYDHRQDLPVLSEQSKVFYRNVYCAICNEDTRLVKWETYLHCNGFGNVTRVGFEDTPDFSSSIYVPRTMNYRGVKVYNESKTCSIIVKNFNPNKLVNVYGGRLCKNAIDSCLNNADPVTIRKCKQYTSFVYDISYFQERMKIYRNFHCAKCNNVTIDNISCYDPYIGIIFGTTYDGRQGLTMLFDFNFEGETRDRSCHLEDGKIWDPIYRQCHNITCGALYKRKGTKCIPIKMPDSKEGLRQDCLKKVLNRDMFHILPNKSIYINTSFEFVSPDAYEISENDSEGISKISVCLDTELMLLPVSDIHYWLSVITLSISVICLILHLAVYGILKKLRNCPGKILMSLAGSLLCGDLFLLLGPHLVKIPWLCYISSVITHFGYMAAFAWMSVMAFDIYRTFSVTQSQRSRRATVFVRYSIFGWIAAASVVSLSISMDNLLGYSNRFRPKYGDPICWFNHKYGFLVFFIIPVAILLFSNTILFIRTALNIRIVSRQTKMVNNFSEKERFFLYLKLATVLGLTWTLGFVAGVTRLNAFWYPFIILNGLQGALIFLSFSVKRNILNMLAIKFRIRSDKYRMGKPTGMKAAMYTSLSNLSSLQATLSTQISVAPESQEILKAVRKINPDLIVESKKN